jgi:phospholipid transport system substrate-binding protein
MKKNFFIHIVLFSFLFIIPVKSYAYSEDPKQFISEIVVEAKKILNSNLNKDDKTKKLTIIAKKTVDIKGIAFYTLGNYRKNLEDEEKKEYLNLFEQYFLKSFTSRLTDHSNPKIEVIETEVLNPKYTIVKSLLLASEDRPEIKIDWRVYTKNPSNPLIRDLIIEGLSLARTQKEEFASIMQSNNDDISQLFAKLQEFIDK